MDRKEAKEIAKANLGNYLMQKGININRPFLCLNPEHNDHAPSMYYDKRRNKCHCFSCGVDADIFDVIAWDYHTSPAETFDVAYDIFGIEVEKNDKRKKEREIWIPSIKPCEATSHEEIKCAPEEVCHTVYEIMKREFGLTEKDTEYLKKERKLPKKRIQADYFRVSTNQKKKDEIIKKIQKETGYGVDILKYVPGFFVWKKTGRLDFVTKDGIGILIRNAAGQAVAVQIRKDTVKDKAMRYCWMSSKFAVDNELCDGGSTPKSPKDILIPENPRKTLCITEGRFKSEILALNRNISISVQGVLNWKGIEESIDDIIKLYDIKHIFLMFDADVMGNPQILPGLPALIDMLRKRYPSIRVSEAVWKKEYGKGIDDMIINGHVNDVRYIPADEFAKTCLKTMSVLMKEFKVQSVSSLGERKAEFLEKLQETNENIFLEEPTGRAA